MNSKQKYTFGGVLMVLIVMGVYVLFFLKINGHNFLTTKKVTSTTSTTPAAAPPLVELNQICNCSLIVTDGAQIQTLNPLTSARTTTIVSGGNGEGGTPMPGYAGMSPSGKWAILNDIAHHKLLLLDSSTGKTVRTLSIDLNLNLTTMAWSPNEAVVLLSFNRQLSNGTLSTDTPEFIIWQTNNHRTVTNVPAWTSQQSTTLLSINDDASYAIIGWSDGRVAELYQVTSTGQPKKIILPSTTLQSTTTNTADTLAAISHGHALFASGKVIYNIDIASATATSLMNDPWSGLPLSPISPDGDSIIMLHHQPGTAHGEARRYIPSLNDTVTIVPTFDIGDGFRQAVWLPGGRFLALQDSYGHVWYVIDTSLGSVPMRRLTMPNLTPDDQVTGFWQTSPMTIEQMSLYDLGGHELTLAQQKTLETQLTDWTMYSPDTTTQLRGGACGYPDADKQLAAIEAAGEKTLRLNQAMPITITPNVFHWTATQLSSFADQIICGVGGPFPKAIADNNIVWWGQCLGGIGPGPGAETRQAIQCLQAEEVVNRYFHQEQYLQ